MQTSHGCDYIQFPSLVLAPFLFLCFQTKHNHQEVQNCSSKYKAKENKYRNVYSMRM